MGREPALIIGALEAAVIAIVGLIAILADWDAELTAAVVAAASAVVALVGAVLTRQRVTPA